MNPSLYQELKMFAMSILPLSKDAFHIYIGFACFVLSVFWLRRREYSFQVLILGIVVALAMEAVDLYDDLHSLGRMRWLASFKDLINTNAIPFFLVLLQRRFRKRQPQP